jgi:hypothetical protein
VGILSGPLHGLRVLDRTTRMKKCSTPWGVGVVVAPRSSGIIGVIEREFYGYEAEREVPLDWPEGNDRWPEIAEGSER